MPNSSIGPVAIFSDLEEQGKLDFDWNEVFEIFKKPNVNKEKIVFPKLNAQKIKEILVERHEFSAERVENHIAKLIDVKKGEGQKKLF